MALISGDNTTIFSSKLFWGLWNVCDPYLCVFRTIIRYIWSSSFVGIEWCTRLPHEVSVRPAVDFRLSIVGFWSNIAEICPKQRYITFLIWSANLTSLLFAPFTHICTSLVQTSVYSSRIWSSGVKSYFPVGCEKWWPLWSICTFGLSHVAGHVTRHKKIGLSHGQRCGHD